MCCLQSGELEMRGLHYLIVISVNHEARSTSFFFLLVSMDIVLLKTVSIPCLELYKAKRKL